MSKRISVAALAAVLTFGAGRAGAQITTVITPPKPSPTRQAEAARQQVARQDSVARVTLTDMKQWVDSAASALALRPDTAAAPADTAVTAPAPPQARTDSAPAPAPRQREAAQPEFREGARAPATATSVPSLALVGAGLIVLGLIVRRRAGPVSVRVKR